MADRDELIAQLGQTAGALRELAAAAGEDALGFRPAPDDWSIREILAHLVDDEAFIMRNRLERIVKEERPHLAPHDEQRWYAHRSTARDGLTELLGDFSTQRTASLSVMALLRPDDWQRVGFQPEYGEFTAEAWLGRWLDHDKVHLAQIATNLAAFKRQV
jgi:DinB family protein